MDVRREDYDHLVSLIYEMRQGDEHAVVFQARPDAPRVPITVRSPEPREWEIWANAGAVDPNGLALWHWHILPVYDGRRYVIRQVFRDGLRVRHGEYRHSMEAASAALGLAFKALS